MRKNDKQKENHQGTNQERNGTNQNENGLNHRAENLEVTKCQKKKEKEN